MGTISPEGQSPSSSNEQLGPRHERYLGLAKSSTEAMIALINQSEIIQLADLGHRRDLLARELAHPWIMSACLETPQEDRQTRLQAWASHAEDLKAQKLRELLELSGNEVPAEDLNHYHPDMHILQGIEMGIRVVIEDMFGEKPEALLHHQV